jgi:two-component system nitrogen regulation sensor histidine kinase GlnL
MSTDATRLDEILGSLRAGILAVDGHGYIELMNAEASRILGQSGEATLGRTFEDCLGVGHPVATLLQGALAEGRDISANGVRIRGFLDRELVLDLSATPVTHADPPGGAVVTLHDRTLGQELEAHAEQITRSEVFARLAAGIAHELRNPLAGIRGAAELLEMKLDDPDLRRYPQLIRDQADRMRRLLDDLSQLTHGGDLRLEPTNLHHVLDRLLELQAETPEWFGLDVRREYDPSIPDLELDPDRLEQVILNLVRNAAQAMENRGVLTIRTRVESSYQLGERSRAQSLVRIEVEDTGPGIPEDELEHIFTPFYTRGKVGGTGLGLAIAQHWVVRHGGYIQVSSREGHGTRMRVLLPLRRGG